jgi:hypothetical protein
MANATLLEEKLRDIVASAGGGDDLRPPDDCRDKLGWYLDLIGELLRAGGGGSGGGGVTTHRLLSGRDAIDQHPIGAITSLQTALDTLNQAITIHKSSSSDHNDIRMAITDLQQAVNNLNIPSLAPYRTAVAQDAIDNQIKQTIAEETVKPSALNDYAKKDDLPNTSGFVDQSTLNNSIETHNEDETAHGINELKKDVKDLLEEGPASVQSISNAEIQEILNLL